MTSVAAFSPAPSAAALDDFTPEQKTYLHGFVAGADAVRAIQGLGPLLARPAPVPGAGGVTAAAGFRCPSVLHQRAQDHVLSAGGVLTAEERAKRDKNPLDMWDEIRANAGAAVMPSGADVFRYKFHGLFNVAPAQEGFMCRLRIPHGILSAHQMRGLADLARRASGGYAHITTRANLQFREIPAGQALEFLETLFDLGLTGRGAGGDNVRNLTGSPLAGIDPQEIIDTRPLARALHHHILNHRELFGLPRKFNIAWDGGGTIPVLEETNDIGFQAVEVGEGRAVPPGVHFRMLLGGATGHEGIAFDSGALIAPEACLPVTDAILRVFIDHGIRTDRRKARLKTLVDNWGEDRFLAEVEKVLGAPLPRLSRLASPPRPPRQRTAHLGLHPQRQEGRFYAGLVVPVGRLEADQMDALAAIARRWGDGTLRLTVWQNVILSGLSAATLSEVEAALSAIGLGWQADPLAAGLVACTGSGGCKFAAANTKADALAIATHVRRSLTLDQPVNIHVTGCPNSCAQHRIADIGLIGARIEIQTAEGDDLHAGYHLHVGGGFGDDPALTREIRRDVPAEAAPAAVAGLLAAWQRQRVCADESFAAFVRRHPTEALRAFACA